MTNEREAKMPAKNHGRRRRWWLFGCGAALFLALLPVAAYRICVWGPRSYAAARVEEEAAWWRSRWPEVPDARNRLFAYRDVLERVEQARQDLGGGRWWKGCLTRLPELGDSWPDEDAFIRDALAARTEMLDSFEAAAGLPEHRLPSTYLERDDEDSLFRQVAQGYWGSGSGSVDAHRELFQTMACRAWIDLREGHRQAGSERLTSLLRFTADTGRGGAVARLMLGVAALNNVAMVVLDTANLPYWTAEGLRALADSLHSELARFPGVADAVRTERLGMLMRVSRGAPVYVPGRRLLGPYVHLMEATSVKRFDAFMDRLISSLSSTRREWKAKEEGLMNEIVTAKRATDWRDFMIALHVPGLYVRDLFDTSLANVSVAIAALRMRAVFLESGAYPQSMEALSEADERPIVRDPFSGAPLGVDVREDGSAIVYHIGRNETDEGGRNRRIESLHKHPPRKPEPGTDDAGSVGIYWGYSPDDFGIELRGVSLAGEREAE